jgi:hypothetical protein
MTMSGALMLTMLVAAQDGPPYPPVPPEERLVGLAYQTWFPPVGWDYVWGTPELGHYRSDDPQVIRQHAEWIAWAGVDFIWIDWSNNVTHAPDMEGRDAVVRDGERYLAYRPDIASIETATRRLLEVYADLETHPKVSIFIGCPDAPGAVADGRLQRKADQIYEDFITHPEYGPMFQTYLGKPLLAVYVGTPSPFRSGLPEWDDPRFTVRWFTGYVSEQANLRTEDRVSKYGYWAWEDRGPQTYAVHDGKPEAMVVTAAYRPQAEPGERGYIPAKGRREGETFREAWARARKIGPKLAMVVAWNEWTLGESRSAEISKDLEPSEEFGHFYLELLREEIRKFKGGDE